MTRHRSSVSEGASGGNRAAFRIFLLLTGGFLLLWAIQGIAGWAYHCSYSEVYTSPEWCSVETPMEYALGQIRLISPWFFLWVIGGSIVSLAMPETN